MLASFLLTIVMLEGALRIFFAPYITAIYELDDACLFRPKANSAHYWQKVPPNDFDVLVRINDQGYRGPDRGFKAAETTVLVYGDSFVMAEFSPFELTYCARLEHALRVDRTAAGHSAPVHVVNGGIAGGGPDQYIPRLESECATVQPDLVIVAIYAGNDFGDLVRDKMFRVDPGGGDDVIDNPWTFSGKVKQEFAMAEKPAIWRMVHRLRTDRRLTAGWESMAAAEGAERLAMSHRMLEADLTLCREEYDAYVEHGRNDVRKLLDDHYDSDIAVEPESDSARYKVALMRGVMRKLHKTAVANNVPLLFVAIPAPTDVIPEYRGGTPDTAKYPEYEAARLTTIVSDIAADLGVPCLDLFEPFKARGQDVYLYAPDVHWNAAGQLQAAELTVAEIRESSLLR